MLLEVDIVAENAHEHGPPPAWPDLQGRTGVQKHPQGGHEQEHIVDGKSIQNIRAIQWELKCFQCVMDHHGRKTTVSAVGPDEGIRLPKPFCDAKVT